MKHIGFEYKNAIFTFVFKVPKRLDKISLKILFSDFKISTKIEMMPHIKFVIVAEMVLISSFKQKDTACHKHSSDL